MYIAAALLVALAAPAAAEPALIPWRSIGRPEPAAPPRWTAVDTLIEGGVLLTLFSDYLQTRQILATPECRPTDWHCRTGGEGNPAARALGAELYFGLAAAAHVAISYALPPRLRHVFQGVTIGVQAATIRRNMMYGYAIRF